MGEIGADQLAHADKDSMLRAVGEASPSFHGVHSYFSPCIAASEQSQSHSSTPSDGSFSCPIVQTSSGEERFL